LAIREFQSGYIKFYYEDVTVGNRNSINEYNQDSEVRRQLWQTGVGDIVIDIGAGFGSYTIQALANAAGFVYAFEHDPHIASALKQNLQRNRTLSAAERSSICRWHLDDASHTLDMYLADLSFPISRLDWIKIDLGSIPDNRTVLWGCEGSIKKFKPSILIADPEPPILPFLKAYTDVRVVNGHAFLSPIK